MTAQVLGSRPGAAVAVMATALMLATSACTSSADGGGSGSATSGSATSVAPVTSTPQPTATSSSAGGTSPSSSGAPSSAPSASVGPPTPAPPTTVPTTAAPPTLSVCALLTPAQVRAALGGPVRTRRNEPIGEFRSCGWYGARAGAQVPPLVQVQVSGRRYTRQEFQTAARRLAVGPLRAVSGVGDAAYRSGDQTSGTYLTALRGSTFLQVLVTGTGHDVDRAVTVARAVAARLPSR